MRREDAHAHHCGNRQLVIASHYSCAIVNVAKSFMTDTMNSPSNTMNAELPAADARLEQIRLWVRDVLRRDDLRIEPASADASFRRYFRITSLADTATWIVMDAPPEKEDVGPYIHVAA